MLHESDFSLRGTGEVYFLKYAVLGEEGSNNMTRIPRSKQVRRKLYNSHSFPKPRRVSLTICGQIEVFKRRSAWSTSLGQRAVLATAAADRRVEFLTE